MRIINPLVTKKYSLVCAFLLGIFPFMINGWINANIYQNVPIYWAFELFCWIFLPVVIFSYLFKYQDIKWADLGLHDKINGLKNQELLALLCLLLFFIDYPIYKLSLGFANSLIQSQAVFSYQLIQPRVILLKILSVIYFAMTAGIVEELYYRGLLHKIAQSFRRSKMLYLIASPALFALSHWEQGAQNIVATGMFGFLSCLFYLKFKNLWPLIIGHIATDFFWFL